MIVVLGLIVLGLIVLVVIAARRARTVQTPRAVGTDQHRGWFGKL